MFNILGKAHSADVSVASQHWHLSQDAVVGSASPEAPTDFQLNTPDDLTYLSVLGHAYHATDFVVDTVPVGRRFTAVGQNPNDVFTLTSLGTVEGTLMLDGGGGIANELHVTIEARAGATVSLAGKYMVTQVRPHPPPALTCPPSLSSLPPPPFSDATCHNFCACAWHMQTRARADESRGSWAPRRPTGRSPRHSQCRDELWWLNEYHDCNRGDVHGEVMGLAGNPVNIQDSQKKHSQQMQATIQRQPKQGKKTQTQHAD